MTFSPIIGALDSTYIPIQTGYYAVEVTKGLCLYTTNIYYFQENSGIASNTLIEQIHVYPNPCKNFLNVDTEGNHQAINILVSDLTGRIVHIYYFKNLLTIKIDLTFLKSGIYNLTIKSNETYYSTIIIKE